MKIVCISDVAGEDIHWMALTPGKTYSIISLDNTHYQIIDDFGQLYWFRKELFVSLEDKRIDKINQLLL
jgi:hypothetical protein